MKLSIIIPCYNEEKTIGEIVDKVCNLSIDKEIIIVNDGSTDNTKTILDTKINNKVNKIIHQNNKGKGAALRAGFSVATGDILIPQDGDLELNPEEIINVIKPIIDNKTDAAVGSRFLNTKMKGKLFYKLANYILSKFASLCFKQKITDVNTCYIAFKRSLLDKLDLKESGFAINHELFGRISSLNIKIIETPISYYPRSSKEGKKLKYTDGFKALKTIWKYRKKHRT